MAGNQADLQRPVQVRIDELVESGAETGVDPVEGLRARISDAVPGQSTVEQIPPSRGLAFAS